MLASVGASSLPPPGQVNGDFILPPGPSFHPAAAPLASGFPGCRPCLACSPFCFSPSSPSFAQGQIGKVAALFCLEDDPVDSVFGSDSFVTMSTNARRTNLLSAFQTKRSPLSTRGTFSGDARSGRVSPKGDSHIGPSGEGDAWQGTRAFGRTLDGSPSASSSSWLAVRRDLSCGFPRYVWQPLIRGSVVVFRFSAPPFVTMLCISPLSLSWLLLGCPLDCLREYRGTALFGAAFLWGGAH